MGLNLKMFDTLGMMTVVTPPSMMNPEKLSFTIINLREKEKNHFAKELNTLFPNDNITVYIYEKDKAPIWSKEMAPENKTYYVSEEQTIEQTFKVINKTEREA